MRFGFKAAITAAVAGPAIAALMLMGAGPANAAVTTPHATSDPIFGFCNPFFQNQNPFGHQREQWNLSGDNTVVATLNGSSMIFNYSVDFTQRGACLGGSLTDPFFPTTGPIRGTVFGNFVTFKFRYPSSGAQGTRTYVGTINRWGDVHGTWSDSGDGATGFWHLTRDAHHACQRFFWWDPNRACFLF